MSTRLKSRRCIYISDELWEAAQKIAERKETSISKLIEKSLGREVGVKRTEKSFPRYRP